MKPNQELNPHKPANIETIKKQEFIEINTIKCIKTPKNNTWKKQAKEKPLRASPLGVLTWVA